MPRLPLNQVKCEGYGGRIAEVENEREGRILLWLY